MTTAGRSYRIISADSHTVEPPDLWDKWLERKYRDTAPQLVDDGDGGDAWIYMGGNTPQPLGLVTCVGTYHVSFRTNVRKSPSHFAVS